jgi:serine/threonine protein kinase
MVISPKPSYSRLPPPVRTHPITSPPTQTPALQPSSPPWPCSPFAYDTLRTLSSNAASSLHIASPTTGPSAISGALLAVRTHRMPLTSHARAEHACLALLADARCTSPYLLRALASWEDTGIGSLYIVAEYCDLGNLLSRIQNEGRIPTSKARRWASEIVRPPRLFVQHFGVSYHESCA